MKKPPGMTAALGRTCPHCFSMIDPVWFGWHISKCESSNKHVTSTLKQDMAPETPVKNNIADDSQIARLRLPSIEDDTMQHPDANKEQLDQLRGENQLLTDKVKSLELKIEDLQSQLKRSKEAEMKALCMVKSLCASLREKNGQANEEGLHSQPMETSIVERKATGLVEHMGVEPVVKDKFSCQKHVEVVDLDDCADHLKEKDEAIDFAKKGDMDKKLGLDHIVDLACGEGSMSQDFFSHVDGFIKAKVACPTIVNSSRKQRILRRALINGSNENDNQDSSEKSRKSDSAELGVEVVLANLHNRSSATDVPHEDNHFSSRTSECFVIAVDEEVPSMSTAPRDVLGAACLGKNFNNMGCSNSFQADGHGGASVNGDSAGKTSHCSAEAGANGPALEMQYKVVDTVLNAEMQSRVVLPQVFNEKESALNAQQIKETQSRSSSFNTGSNVNAVRAKSGFRRMVLQSDSESESGKIQDTPAGKCESLVCKSKGSALPSTSTEAIGEQGSVLPAMSSEAFGEQNDKSSVGSGAEKKRTSDGIEKKVSQPPSRRSKRVKVVHSSDGVEKKVSQPHSRRSKRLKVVHSSGESDHATCKGESEQSSHRSPQGPEIAATDFEKASVDGIIDGEHTGVRRSKRLRKASLQSSKGNFRNIPLRKKRMPVEELSSSCAETIEGSESEASASSYSIAFEAHGKRRGCRRTRKRLFEQVESRTLDGNNGSTGSETDDSKIESDADSLEGFITESEGEENSQSSNENHSSSSSYSSLEVYFNQRHNRDLKIKHYVWELEGEMLSVLAIDPKLCLRAVCALNRRQTEDEQKEKASKYSNKRGFDTLHAARGSRLAEFLTDGDPSGPVKKSVEDLEKFDAGALEFCKMLAAKHSKQLFEMYRNAEDPHFPFS